MIIYYIIQKLRFNRNTERLLISYIINQNKFDETMLTINVINKIKEVAKKLGRYEKDYFYKKLYSKKVDKFVNELVIKIRKEMESEET